MSLEARLIGTPSNVDVSIPAENTPREFVVLSLTDENGFRTKVYVDRSEAEAIADVLRQALDGDSRNAYRFLA